MAKTHNNPKPSLFLCCFGSSNIMDSSYDNPKPIRKSRWFSWRSSWIRNAKSSTKTVPLDNINTSISDHRQEEEEEEEEVRPMKMKSSKSKSKSQKASLVIVNSPTPQTNIQEPPCHTTPPTKQRHKHHTNDQPNGNHRPHGVASPEDDTRQQNTISLPTTSKRQLPTRPSSSSVSISRPDLKTTSSHQPIRRQNANGTSYYGPMMGMCMLVVTLVIMIVWGRLCAILCTSAWLYFVPRFNKTTAHEGNDVVINTQNSKEEDYLDSEVYKKRVVLEGLLERNHR